MQFPRSALRLQIGRGWELPASTIALRDSGEFVLPASIRLATVFADINGNGTLDRFAEPSSPCTRRDAQWSCELDDTRLLVHRLVRTHPKGERQDRTIAMAEVYGDHGQAILDAKLCDHRGTCAIPTSGPYSAADTGLLLGLCALDRGIVNYEDLRFTPPNRESATYRVHSPPGLQLDVALARLPAGELEVHADTDLPLDRVLVWLGEFEQDQLVRVHATSEQPDTQLRLTDRAATAVFPAAALDRCARSARCRLVVQAAHVVDGPSIPTITEAERFFEVL